MIIFVDVATLLIILVLAGIGITWEVIDSVYSWMPVLSMSLFAISGIVSAIITLGITVEERKFVGVLYAIIIIISSLFFPYYIYSSFCVVTNSIENAWWLTPIISAVVLVIIDSIGMASIESGKIKDFIIFFVLLLGITLISSIYVYGEWKNQALASGLRDENTSYIVETEVKPRIKNRYKTRNGKHSDNIIFPYWTDNTRYYLDSFKKGEEVFPLKGSSDLGRYCSIDFDDELEQAILVCDAKKNTVGYIPERYLKSSIEEKNKKVEVMKIKGKGKEYSGVKCVRLESGQSYDRTVIKFLDENQLKYKYGKYRYTENMTNYKIETYWTLEEVYEEGTYEYELEYEEGSDEIVDIKFNGESYPAEVDVLENKIKNLYGFNCSQ